MSSDPPIAARLRQPDLGPRIEGEDCMQDEAEAALAKAKSYIAFLMKSPHVSNWLKATLRAAHGHNALMLQNETEIMRSIISPLACGSYDSAVRPLLLE